MLDQIPWDPCISRFTTKRKHIQLHNTVFPMHASLLKHLFLIACDMVWHGYGYGSKRWYPVVPLPSRNLWMFIPLSDVISHSLDPFHSHLGYLGWGFFGKPPNPCNIVPIPSIKKKQNIPNTAQPWTSSNVVPAEPGEKPGRKSQCPKPCRSGLATLSVRL